MHPTCAACGKEIKPEQASIHHQRLAADIHATCPMTDVRGEDITNHSVMFIPAKES